jgi:hypothetical protein
MDSEGERSSQRFKEEIDVFPFNSKAFYLAIWLWNLNEID